MGFDWLAYKAEVAARMLPYVYQQVLKDMEESNSRIIRDAADVAIDKTIDITIDMTERLEKRLKGGQR